MCQQLTLWLTFGAVEDPELAHIEKELCRLPEVNAARIVADDIGRPRELHILANADKSPKQIARDVQSVAMASFGMEIDHRIISVVQLDRSHLEPVVAPVGQARVSIGAISSEQRGMRNHARVTLQRGDDEAVGLAEGSIAESSRNRAVAQATLEALRHLVSGAESADVEMAVLLPLGGREVAVVTLVFLVPPLEEIVSGSAVVRGGNESEALARAVLDASNRRLQAPVEVR
ncbi:MAG: hypothetical protein JO086_16960 [Acidimicrobiia bacterium]|nr:hypothetical protein [Acidimicrobiia bacterium]